jgi:hypothetical protein
MRTAHCEQRPEVALDPTDPNLINDEITTIDNALTRPWTVTRQFKPHRQPGMGRILLS